MGKWEMDKVCQVDSGSGLKAMPLAKIFDSPFEQPLNDFKNQLQIAINFKYCNLRLFIMFIILKSCGQWPF